MIYRISLKFVPTIINYQRLLNIFSLVSARTYYSVIFYNTSHILMNNEEIIRLGTDDRQVDIML